MHTNDAVLAPLPHRRRTSSFSSSLLDAICRSLDDDSSAADGGDDELIKMKKQSACSELVSAKDFFTELNAAAATDSASSSSGSSSRGGSSGAVFSSSSDAESNSNRRISSISISQRNRLKLDQNRAKKIHGFSSSDDAESNSNGRISSISPRNRSSLDQNRKNKIHGELKKQRQPISPGARIASFLNSIFSSGNGNKVKICSTGGTDREIAERKPKSTCSSCFSKTPPPRTKESRNGGDRSVRFHPGRVMVDDDPGLMPIRKVDKKDDELLYIRHNLKKKIAEFDFGSYVDEDEDSEEEDEDLFELDHLIGDGRLGEELPVFGTTDFKANQAIANGFAV